MLLLDGDLASDDDKWDNTSVHFAVTIEMGQSRTFKVFRFIPDVLQLVLALKRPGVLRRAVFRQPRGCAPFPTLTSLQPWYGAINERQIYHSYDSRAIT
jgi:hypothetical protein